MRILVFFYLISSMGHGALANSVDCFTSPVTTSFVLRKSEDGTKYNLSVIHHNGVEHAPLITGITTGYTIDIAKKRFEYVKQMGDFFSVSFEPERCKFSKERISCFFSKKAKIGELEVEDYYFHAYKEISVTPFGDFPQFNVSFQYRVNKRPHEMRMFYENDFCRIEIENEND